MFQRALLLQRNTVNQRALIALTNESKHQLSRALSTNSSGELVRQQSPSTSYIDFAGRVCDSMGVQSGLAEVIKNVGAKIIEKQPDIHGMVARELEKIEKEGRLDTFLDFVPSDTTSRAQIEEVDPDMEHSLFISRMWSKLRGLIHSISSSVMGIFDNATLPFLTEPAQNDRSNASTTAEENESDDKSKNYAPIVYGVAGMAVFMVVGYVVLTTLGLDSTWIRHEIGKTLFRGTTPV